MAALLAGAASHVLMEPRALIQINAGARLPQPDRHDPATNE
jgi:hypothetical protein